MKLKTQKISLLVIFLIFLVVNYSCRKEMVPTQDLQLSTQNITLMDGGSISISIVSGNGEYSISASSIVDIEIQGNSIRVQANGYGKEVLTLRDAAGKTAFIEVIVTSTMLDAKTSRFVWDGTIYLDESNGWGITRTISRVALTNIKEKRQYVLTWYGGFVVGEKVDATLKVITDGESTVDLPVEKLHVLSDEDNLYSIVFQCQNQLGELVFAK